MAGLKAARSLFPDATVHVRMDSKLVVEQMSGRWKIKHPDMKPLAAEAGRVFPAGRVRYEWIPRERNKHADRLANEAMDAGKRGRQWEPSDSTAALDTAAARNAAILPPAPSGPPGDATAGAARARAALATGAGTGTSGDLGQGRTGSGSGTGSGAWPGTVAHPTAQDDGLFAAEEALTAPASGDFEAQAGALAPTGHAARTHAPEADATPAGAPPETTGPETTGPETPGPETTGTAAAAAPATRSEPTGPETAAAPAGSVPAPAAQPASAASAAPGQGWSAGPDMSAPATFVLLRHGETALTPEKRFSGSGGTDPALSAAGPRDVPATRVVPGVRDAVARVRGADHPQFDLAAGHRILHTAPVEAGREDAVKARGRQRPHGKRVAVGQGQPDVLALLVGIAGDPQLLLGRPVVGLEILVSEGPPPPVPEDLGVEVLRQHPGCEPGPDVAGTAVGADVSAGVRQRPVLPEMPGRPVPGGPARAGDVRRLGRG
ncbi:reverse transcriptase-like protein, partial [Streptomyces massasporeus]